MLQQVGTTRAPVLTRLLLRPKPASTTFRSLHSTVSCNAYQHPQQARARPRAWEQSSSRNVASDISVKAVSSGLSGDSELYLIVYSKPGCHLCDGLKDKISAVLDKAMFQPSPLSKASLQIRNILDEPEWEQAYGLAIPVMTAIKRGESEEIKIPRAPPRITADRLHKHIVEALNL